MIYGYATVEIAESPDQASVGHGEILEGTEYGLVWVRYNVRHFVRRHNGYEFSIVGGAGLGWSHETNFRNFVRDDTYDNNEEYEVRNLLAGQRD